MNSFNIMNILKTIKNSANPMSGTTIFSSIFIISIVGVCLLGIMIPRPTNADFANTTNAPYVAKTATSAAQKATKTIKVIITAYSSTEDQTDDTPLITASGKTVGDGIIANNMLPFGTKIKIPKLYGDKVFTVEDRMSKKKSDYHIDIWMPTRPSAINFGIKTAEIEVL